MVSLKHLLSMLTANYIHWRFVKLFIGI